MLCAVVIATIARAAATGTLKLDVMGDLGAGAKNSAHVIASDGKEVGQVAPGATIALPPGTYRVDLPIIGGHMSKDNIAIESGRTHTVLIQNVAVMQVDVTDRTGKDPGFGVTVTSSDDPNKKLATFVSGDKVLFAPMLVDVNVDAPPQGYNWHAVEMKPGERAHLTLDEMVKAQLVIQPALQKLPIDKSTRVVVYHAGTQSQVAESAPGPEHRFELDPGDYDVYVENRAGKGRPYVTVPGIHLDSGAKLERQVPMD
ncbi:MAG TPA: hypothetical protein VEJ86_09030 [Candidatus Binataceae bacterium]|nr:hypothetical protein [Candidatus Binataceae bacterium]